MRRLKQQIERIADLYIQGFKSMTLGRTLWGIILIKLFIMFAILRTIFFPNFLGSKFDNDQAKSDYVGSQLIEKSE